MNRSLSSVIRATPAAILAVLLVSCGPRPLPPSPVSDPLPLPQPEEVESVLFLLGDAGDAVAERSPILTKLGEDVDWWAERLEADSSVAVLILGDIIYPEGMRDPGDSEYDRDTAVVMSQVRLVGGPSARQRGARIYFVAGNHDWGLREDREGYVRLANLATFLEGVRDASGIPAYLVPDAGTGGPYVLDWGTRFRLLLLDTAWWLVNADLPAKQEVLRGIDQAFATAGDREIALVAHHPFRSGGPHGGGFSIAEALGLRYILHRSGAVLQDVTSVPYRELETGLRNIFGRYGPPLVFIGGHEHSLQVLGSAEPTDPQYSLVSGAGSKLSQIGPAASMLFGLSAPGYMKLVMEKDGDVGLYVEAAPRSYLHCEPAEVIPNPCVVEGLDSIRTVFSRRLE